MSKKGVVPFSRRWVKMMILAGCERAFDQNDWRKEVWSKVLAFENAMVKLV